MRLAASRTFCTAGKRSPTRTAMMAMTTRSSINVMPPREPRMIGNLQEIAGQQEPIPPSGLKDEIKTVCSVGLHFCLELGLRVVTRGDPVPCGRATHAIRFGLADDDRRLDRYPIDPWDQAVLCGNRVLPVADQGSGGGATRREKLDRSIRKRQTGKAHR